MLRSCVASLLSLLVISSAVVDAGQIRLSGGGGTPSVIEVLGNTSFVVNSGASFSGYAIYFSVPNSVTALPSTGPWYMTGAPAMSVYKAASGTTQFLGTNFNGNYSDFRLNSLEVRQNGSGMSFYAEFPNASEYAFQPNDVITLISGSYQLGASTNGAWISPGSLYSITPNSMGTSTEGTNYSPSDVSVVPEPASMALMGGGACLLGLIWRRSRVPASGAKKPPVMG